MLDAGLKEITPRLITRLKKAYSLTDAQAQDMVDRVNQADPTASEADYTPWLIGEIISGNLPLLFDVEEIREVLRLFSINKNKRTWAAPKDIFKLTWKSLNDTLDQLRESGKLAVESISRTERPAAPEVTPGVRIIYNTSAWQIREASTVEGLIAVSRGTKWCTREEIGAVGYIDKYKKIYCIYKRGRTFALWSSPTYVRDESGYDLGEDDFVQIFGIMAKIGAINLGNISGRDWLELLPIYPSLAEYCDLSKIGYSNGWVPFLKMQPQFAAHFNDWHLLDGADWSSLLSTQPQFSEHCDWEKLSGGNWAYLLSVQPQLAQYCDWNVLDGYSWVWLLMRQPQFFDRCDWRGLNNQHWQELLNVHPEFEKYRKNASLTKFLLEE